MFRGGHPIEYRRVGLDCRTTHQAQASKKLKMERVGSPTRDRSRSRVRSVLKSVGSTNSLISPNRMAEIFKFATHNINGMSAEGGGE